MHLAGLELTMLLAQEVRPIAVLYTAFNKVSILSGRYQQAVPGAGLLGIQGPVGTYPLAPPGGCSPQRGSGRVTLTT